MGVDLAEVRRVRLAVERFGARFLERVFTPRELAYVDKRGTASRFERLAARFAAKEAGMKAIGTGWRRGVRWLDLEVSNLPTGRPTLLLHGVAKEVAAQLNVHNIVLTLTHTSEQALAVVILES